VPTRVIRLTRAESQPCATAAYPRRDSNAHCQRPQRCASAIGLRGPGAFGRDRTGCLRLTRTPLCRVSYEGISWDTRLRTWKAPGPEPGGSASSPISHRCGRRESNPHELLLTKGLSLARLPVTPRPRAPPGPRTRNPLIKSQLHVHLCLQRESRDEWARTSVLRAPSAALQPN
jgi:hypothetical protein